RRGSPLCPCRTLFRSEEEEPAHGGEQAVILAGGGAGDGVENHVHASASGETADLGLEVAVAVVDGVVEAHLAQARVLARAGRAKSEEHTSELQSREKL